jgi:hypothetical protein
VPSHLISNVFCIRPGGEDVGDDALFLGVRHLVHAAFGPWVNLIPIPARRDGLGRGGLTHRTVYEINLFGHGVVVCGGAATEPGWLDVDRDALGKIDVPILVCGLSDVPAEDLDDRVAGLPASTIRAVAEHARTLLVRDELTARRLADLGVANARIGGCPSLFLDRALRALDPGASFEGLPRPGDAAALITVRDPAALPLKPTRRAQIHADVRSVLWQLQHIGHQNVLLSCQDRRDLNFAASLPDVDAVYTDDVRIWLKRLEGCPVHVTWRTETALTCLTLGVPYIHLACDDVSLALMETARIGGWSIDVRTVQDLRTAVAGRLDRIDALAESRLTAMPSWGTLERESAGAFARFAEAVRTARHGDPHRRQARGTPPPISFLGAEPTSVDVQRTPPLPLLPGRPKP